MYSRNRRRRSPWLIVGLCVPVVLALIAGGSLLLPYLFSHAATATPNPNCTLIVPANPLSATGLATPYQLFAPDAAANGPCNEANANQSAFVQGVIFNPAADTFSVYNPLVIDQGTQAAVTPTAPTLPAGAIVGLWFGFNGTNLTLQGANGKTLQQAKCVNGQNGSVFGQFAYCNAVKFFKAANAAIAAGKVTVPALGTAKDGQTCLSTRDFGLIDQDQSDNVQTQYISNGNGQTAQFSAANQAAIANGTVIANPSDNALLTNFVDPALGCTGWTAPNLADNNTPVPALPLDELMAAADQQAPVALVPLTDPMTLNNNNQSLTKTNLYRVGVDQTPAANAAGASGTTYCQNFLQTGIPRLTLDQPLTIVATSPAPAEANSLFTFLAMRDMQSYTNLNCQNLLNVANPVATTVDGNGVVIGATITINGVTTTGGTVTTTTTPTTTTTTTTGGVQQIATGNTTINLDTNAGNAQMALNLTYANHPNQQIDVNLTTTSCSSTPFFTQLEDTDGNGQNAANTVVNGLQGLQAIPATWFFTVSDPTQMVNGQPTVVGCGSVVANGTTGTATLGTVAATTTTTTTTACAATTTTAATTATPAAGTTCATTTTAPTTTAANTGQVTAKNKPYNVKEKHNKW